MWKLSDINAVDGGEGPLIQRVESYIMDKNLNFIVAGAELVNQRQAVLGQEKVMAHLNAYAGCDFSMISIFNGRPAAPFIAADTDPRNDIARVRYLIDFNEEAKQGTASPFYSKVLGAFATHFFSIQPNVDRLWFPVVIHDIVGSKMGVQPEASGTSILRVQGL